MVSFTAERSVDIEVPPQPVPIQHYLRQPHRVVRALVDPSRMTQLSDREFRLQMRTLSFFGLNIQPTVFLRVYVETDGTVKVVSTNCEIRGVDYIDRRFSLQLTGTLRPYQRRERTYLQGLAELEVRVDLPPPLSFMPLAVLEPAGNNLLKSILATFKQRLEHQLIGDYVVWAQTAVSGEHDLRPSLDSKSVGEI